ncbi:MAG: molecular chaperone DjlA [Nitrospinaceae bacterium]|nr:MAG: molecular chaperone DjlA [Nitrospinaceae bacterium]
MSWLWGAGLGFLRGGPLGAVIGGTAQHLLAKKYLKKNNAGLPGVGDQALFVTCLAMVLTKTGMAGGSLSPEQIQVIHKFFKKNFQYGPEELKFIDKVIAETRRLNPDLGPFVEQYKKASNNHYNFLLLALSYQVALIGGLLTEETQKLIDQLAQGLGLSYQDHDRIRQRYSLGQTRNPYTILGVDYSANSEEIKKAYRNKAGQYHPDRVAHLGEREGEEAHMRFLEIQEAFEELEKTGGV